jgi:16S rRNA (cytidine1402-2'-O)-methyltransferase
VLNYFSIESITAKLINFCPLGPLKNKGYVLSDLTLVTLPIGNKGDITIRALEALKSGKVFYAEDTRVFKELLGSLGISYQDKYIDSFHDKSVGKVDIIVSRIKNGENVYLVSDAGSPMISDPAYPLLQKLQEENISVKTLPGVTSVVTALELSLLPPHPFHFWGFLARSKNEKSEFFKKLEAISGTHIFFESPHRITETIETFFEIHNEKTLVVARELTKTYESVYWLKKDDLKRIKDTVIEKGEFVLLFHTEGRASSVEFSKLKELVQDYMDKGGSPKKLAKIFSLVLESDTKTIYDQLTRSVK